MNDEKKLKQLPPLLSDEQAEHEVDTIDLSEYDLSGFKRMKIEDLLKDTRFEIRLPFPLMEAVKTEAARQGIPYSRFIRTAIEHALLH